MRNKHLKLAASFFAVLTALVVSGGCNNFENPDADTQDASADVQQQADIQVDNGQDISQQGTDASSVDAGNHGTDVAVDMQAMVEVQQAETAQEVTTVVAECTVDADCNDNNVCSADICGNGAKCVHVPASGTCDDNNACTDNDTCNAGACKGTAKVCEDSNLCTDDFCISGNCVHGVNTTLCDDNNACTVGDKCSGGTCQGGAAKVCEDNNPCTTDACDPKLGCVMTPVLCEDGNPCTTDSCDSKSGNCSFVQKVCDDGKAWTDDWCADSWSWDWTPGSCVSYVKYKACQKDSDCTDDDPCTVDVCDSFQGQCANVEQQCDDNNPCTFADTCVGGGCYGMAKNCNDYNSNTADSCDKVAGACIHTPISTVPPTSGSTVKVEITCGVVACEVHPFFGLDVGGKSFDNLGPAPANGWYTTDLPKSQLCVWGMEVAARLTSMPSMPFFGCDVGAPSLNTVTVKVNGVVQPGVLTTHPWVCQGSGEGNKKYLPAAFGCP